MKFESQLLDLIHIICQIRSDHPTMGSRDMYYKIQPKELGRDAFESFCKEYGFSIQKTKSFKRTTNSLGVTRFENLTINLTVLYINQLWVSDITFYEINSKFYYLTFIEDACSRRILGHSVSKRLFTEHTTLPALKMALECRGNQINEGLIFHSDGGGQYYDKGFLALTKHHKIKNSMCEYAWENGKAERLNGVIKNNYLIHRGIKDYEQLVKEVDRSVYLYNYEKPHIKLQRKTPIEYENNYLSNSKKSEGDIFIDGIKM